MSWGILKFSDYATLCPSIKMQYPQSSKLTDVSHHKGELSFVSKLRLQLMYDLRELCNKICGIIFHSENSNIITSHIIGT